MLRRSLPLVMLGCLLVVAALGSRVQPGPSAPDPLPSWREGPAKTALVAFVSKVTSEGSPDFVPPQERIAAFDNDGTLWSEQPAYFQLLFAMDRVKAMAASHPEWKDQEPFKSVLAGDLASVAASGEKGIAQVVAATHAGMTVDEFTAVVQEWLRTARHPGTGRPYTEMVYQPMQEALAYLRANGFRTFIVSGGGVDFMRAFAEQVYGVPPEQVVGSRGHYRYELRSGRPCLVKLPTIDLVDDGPGKPVGIQQQVGRPPIVAFGNSDGDFEMLQFTTARSGSRLGVIIHHTDPDREWAYDRASKIGHLERALDAAPAAGWVVVDMRADWKNVFPVPRSN